MGGARNVAAAAFRKANIEVSNLHFDIQIMFRRPAEGTNPS